MSSSKSEFLRILHKQLKKKGILLPIEKLEQLFQHYQMLNEWNKVHNLTKICGITESVVLHYLDCILGLQLFDLGDEIGDLGSGGGFPGLIASIIWPEKKIFLIESSRKKCSFLKLACHELKLRNTKIINDNFLKVLPPKLVISRAAISTSGAKKIAEHLPSGTRLACWLSVEEQKKWLKGCEEWGLEHLETISYQIEKRNIRKISIFLKVRD